MATLSSPIALFRDLKLRSARAERQGARVQQMELTLVGWPQLIVRTKRHLRAVHYLVAAGFDGIILIDGMPQEVAVAYASKHGFHHLLQL